MNSRAPTRSRRCCGLSGCTTPSISCRQGADRWTHRDDATPSKNQQIDYLLISDALWPLLKEVQIERRGIWASAKKTRDEISAAHDHHRRHECGERSRRGLGGFCLAVGGVALSRDVCLREYVDERRRYNCVAKRQSSLACGDSSETYAQISCRQHERKFQQ